MKTFVANLKHQARTGQPCTIGGGVFSSEELTQACNDYDMLIEALQALYEQSCELAKLDEINMFVGGDWHTAHHAACAALKKVNQ